MLIWTNPYVMFQVLGILVLVIVPSLWFGRRVRKLARASQDRVADSSAIAAEVLNAIAVVQSYTAEAREAARFNASTENAFNTAVRRTQARSVLVAFIISATSAALLWGLYQGTQAVIAGRISAGELGQTVVYVIILASAFAVLGEVYGDLLRAAGATERLMELLASRSPITSPSNPVLAPVQLAGSAIKFDNITFNYPSRPNQAALTNFSLAVQPGQTVALVGPSGAGKSSIVNVLLRFWELESGTARLGGTALPELAQDAVRRRIAWVGQDAHLFPTTIGGNIAVARPGATPEELADAARRAQLGPWIDALPEGMDTPVGERGARLSGGQRQRVALARALLAGAPVLVLDEPTAGLDRPTARRLIDDVVTASERTTVVYITHRDEELAPFDEVAVIDGGRVVDSYRAGESGGASPVASGADGMAVARDVRCPRART